MKWLWAWMGTGAQRIGAIVAAIMGVIVAAIHDELSSPKKVDVYGPDKKTQANWQKQWDRGARASRRVPPSPGGAAWDADADYPAGDDPPSGSP